MPTASEFDAAETAIESSCAFVMVSESLPLIPEAESSAVNCTEPGAIEDTSPALETLALAGAEELQFTLEVMTT